MSRPLVILAALAASLALSACGKMGQLERPGPIFGATSRQADRAERQAQDPSRPVDTVDPRDLSTSPAPPRTAPIGGLNDPTRMPPQTAMPNPYADPR